MRKSTLISLICFALCAMGLGILTWLSPSIIVSPAIQRQILRLVNKEIRGHLKVEQVIYSFPTKIYLSNTSLFDENGHIVAQVKTISGNLFLPSLLWNIIQFNDVEASYAFADLRMKSGTLNFVSAVKNKVPSQKPLYLKLNNVRLEHADVQFIEQDDKIDVLARNAQVHANFFLEDDKITLHATDVRSEEGFVTAEEFHLPFSNLKGRNVSIYDDILYAPRVSAHLSDTDTKITGTIDFGKKRYNVNGILEILPHANFFSSVLPFAWPSAIGRVHVTGLFSMPNVEIHAKAKDAVLYDIPIQDIELHGVLTKKGFTIYNSYGVTTPYGLIHSRGQIAFKEKEYDFHVETENASTTALFDFLNMPRVNSQGGVTSTMNISGKIGASQPVNFSAQGFIDRVMVDRFYFPNGNFSVSLTAVPEKYLHFSHLHLNSSDAHVDLSGHLDLQDNTHHLSWNASFANATHLLSLPDFKIRGLSTVGKSFGLIQDPHAEGKVIIHSADWKDLPLTNLESSFLIQDKTISLPSLKANILDGKTKGTVKYDFSQETLQAALNLTKVNLLKLHSFSHNVEPRGLISGDVRIEGPITGLTGSYHAFGDGIEVGVAKLGKIDLTGIYENQTFKIQEGVIQGSLLDAKIESLNVSSTSLKMNGSLTVDTLRLGSLEVFSNILLDLRSAGKASLSGSILNPHVALTLNTQQVNFNNVNVGNGPLYASFSDGLLQISTQLGKDQQLIDLKAAYHFEQDNIHAQLSLHQVDIYPWTSLGTLPIKPLDGLLVGKITLKGPLHSYPALSADLVIPHLRYHNQNSDRPIEIGVFSLKGQIENGHTQFSLRGSPVGNEGPCHTSDWLCVDANGLFEHIKHYSLQGSGQVNYVKLEQLIKSLDVNLMSLDLLSSFQFSLNESPGTRRVFHVDASVEDMRLELPGTPYIRLATPSRIIVENDSLILMDSIEVMIEHRPLTITGGATNSRLHFALEGAIPLIIGKLFTNTIRSADGSAFGKLSIGGTLHQPIAVGTLTPEKGSHLILRRWFEPIEFQSGVIRFEQTPKKLFSVVFNNVQAAIGDGQFSLNGNIDVPNKDNIHLEQLEWNLLVKGYGITLKNQGDFIETNIDVALQTWQETPWLSGEVLVVDGLIKKDFSLDNFIFSSESSFANLKNSLPTISLNLDFRIDALRAIADMTVCALDAVARANLHLTGNLSSPRIRGNAEIIEGIIQFPSVVFEISSAMVPFKSTPGRLLDSEVTLLATAELPKKRFGLKEDTYVELALNGDLNQFELGLKPISGDLRLDKTRILMLLLSAPIGASDEPAQEKATDMISGASSSLLLKPFAKRIEKYVSPTGQHIRFQIGSYLSSHGLSTQLKWQVGPRIEVEGIFATDSLSFRDLKLKLLLFDHLLIGKKLFFEGNFSQTTESFSKEDQQGSLKLKYRLLEK